MLHPTEGGGVEGDGDAKVNRSKVKTLRGQRSPLVQGAVLHIHPTEGGGGRGNRPLSDLNSTPIAQIRFRHPSPIPPGGGGRRARGFELVEARGFELMEDQRV